MNTQVNIEREARECFIPVRAERRPLTSAEWELQLRPFGVQSDAVHSALLQPSAAPRAPCFVEVYVARPISRVLGGWAGES